MIDRLKQVAVSHGDKLQVLSVDCLRQIRSELGSFRRSNQLNSFQRWIVEDMYRLDLPTLDFPIRSIILVAIPHPAYAKVELINRGKAYSLICLVMSEFERTEEYLKNWLERHSYRMQAAPNLPQKRLAVHSGLADYGRNNVSYVDGMGSFFSYAAYFSDLPCEHHVWTEVRQAECCANCGICLNSCPTQAIRPDRFLIDNERCLSCLNEVPGEWPEWLPPSVHHAVYDCLQCQIGCPMNREFVGNVVESIKFSAAETETLLSGQGVGSFSDALKQKSQLLGLTDWLDAIPRNLKTLFAQSDDGQENLSSCQMMFR